MKCTTSWDDFIKHLHFKMRERECHSPLCVWYGHTGIAGEDSTKHGVYPFWYGKIKHVAL